MKATWKSDDGRIRLWLADCLDVVSGWPAGIVDTTICDPSYGVDFRSNKRVDRERFQKIENDETPFVEWIDLVANATKDGGSCLCFYRWDVQEAFVCALQESFDLRSQIVWHKPGGGIGDLKRAFAAEHELALFATKGDFKFPSMRPASVYKIAKVPPSVMEHPTQKPVALIERLIQCTTKENGVVADPCMGVGTTGVACVRSGRRFLGVEKNPEYFAKAVDRIKNAKQTFKSHKSAKSSGGFGDVKKERQPIIRKHKGEPQNASEP